MKVLVVDDSSTMRRILINSLNAIGHKDIIQASDGVQALEALGTDPDIGLILCDWYMPVMDGISVLKKVKANPNTKDIPVIMVTTQAEQGSVMEAIQAGAANYVVKPFSPQTIHEKIKAVLG